MGTPSPLRPTIASRTETIAFRLTPSERASIDQLARADGISTSEYARRAVFHGLSTSLSLLEEATRRGRDDLRPTIERLERDLARSRQANTEWQQFAQTLRRDLAVARAPRDVVAAVTQLLVGSPHARESVAMCWSRLSYYRRRDIWPVAAAVVTDHMEESLRALPISERSIDDQLRLLSRIEWLAEALTLGLLSDSTHLEREAKTGPLWAAYLAAVEEVQLRIKVFDEHARLRAAREAAEAEPRSTKPNLAPDAADPPPS